MTLRKFISIFKTELINIAFRCNFLIIWCYKSNLVDLNRLANQVETFANEMIGVTDLESALTNLEKYYNYNLKKKDNIVYLIIFPSTGNIFSNIIEAITTPTKPPYADKPAVRKVILLYIKVV